MQEFWFEIICFTVLQSLLSASLSVVVAAILARFLWHYKGLFLERPLIILGELIFVMPVMLPSVAFLLLFEDIYGLWGIVSVHVFLNTLYCMTQFQSAYERFLSIAQQQQADLLALTFWERIRFIDVPALSSTLKSTFFVVFALCLSSFSVVLLLGGGPSATTLSIALYYALTVSLDFKAAAFFLMLQSLLSLSLAFLLHQKAAPSQGKGIGQQARPPQPFLKHKKGPFGANLLLGMVFLMYIVPLWRVLTAFKVPVGDKSFVLESTGLTLILGVLGGGGAVALAVSLLTFYLSKGKSIKLAFSLLTALFLSLPTIVLMGGIVLLFQPILDRLELVYAVILLSSILSYLPFALQSFVADFNKLYKLYGHQIQLLNLSFFQSVQTIVWPLLSQKIKKKIALITCFSMGNLIIPLLLGQLKIKTLPVLSYQALLRYDTDLSAFYMLCTLAAMGSIFFIFQGGRKC